MVVAASSMGFFSFFAFGKTFYQSKQTQTLQDILQFSVLSFFAVIIAADVSSTTPPPQGPALLQLCYAFNCVFYIQLYVCIYIYIKTVTNITIIITSNIYYEIILQNV